MAKQSTKNPLQGCPPSAEAPATDAAAVTPSNTDDLPITARALYIGTTGDITVYMADDESATSVVFKAVPVGILPIAVRRVLSTGTGASDIVALY